MKLWLILQTIAFETLSFYLIFDKPMTAATWLAFASSHAVACACFTGVCWILLPIKYKTPVISSISFLFLFNFCLPLIGMIGTSFSLLVALFLPRQQSEVTWVESEKAPLPQSPGDISHVQFGTGALREVLLHNTDSKRRLLAVSAIRNIPKKDAVPLLQLALKDLSDDVRLMAYAALEKIETQINESIALHKKQYARRPTAQKAYEIAQQYWELCYLGIAEGILRTHYLKEAEKHLHQASKIEPSASIDLLLGKVLLAQKRPTEAVAVLDEAMKGGLRTTQVAPYLAEAAYIVKDYEKVREYIHYFPHQRGEKLSQIKEYWG